MMDNYMYEIYRELLQINKVRTSDVCRATGISQTVMSNWKRRGGCLSLSNTEKLAEYFHVSVEYLMRKGSPAEEYAAGFGDPGRDIKTNEENMAIAAELCRNPEMKAVVYACEGLSPEDTRKVVRLINAIRGDRGDMVDKNNL